MFWMELTHPAESLLQKVPISKSAYCAIYACEVALKYVVAAVDSER